ALFGSPGVREARGKVLVRGVAQGWDTGQIALRRLPLSRIALSSAHSYHRRCTMQHRIADGASPVRPEFPSVALLLLMLLAAGASPARADDDRATQRGQMVDEIAAVARSAAAQSGKPVISAGV